MSAPNDVVQFKPEDATLPSGMAKSLRGLGMGLLGLGVLLSAMAIYTDSKRFAHTYLVGFAFVVTLVMGNLILLLIQHVARTSWSVAARRMMEWSASAAPLLLVLAIPVVVWAKDLYEWMGPEAHEDPLLLKKAAYLNPGFFWVRSIIYLVIWSAIATWFARQSRRQDVTGDPELTLKMQKWSAPSILLSGLTLSFWGFDWLMSLQPHWYSTIFGVYVFAGSIVAALSLLALGTIVFQRRGLYGEVSTVEHLHDIGKLLFGFMVFWTYIAFSQYFLIWYANIPEETIFFRVRMAGSWNAISIFLAVGHFAIPFVVLLSRHGKRSHLVLGLMALWMLAMHHLDLYWIVMPTFDHETANPSWIDAAGLLLPVGVFAVWWTTRASRDPIFPVKDPRLAETMRLEQL